jgi:putative transposase
VFNASWQRCRVHFMRNVLAYAGKNGRRVVSAFIATAFAQDDAQAARAQWRKVADQLRPKLSKLAAFLDEAEADVLAYMSFPTTHRTKLHSTNPLERVNGEIKRRTDVVGIFPNEAAIVRLVGAIETENKVYQERMMSHASRRGALRQPTRRCSSDSRPPSELFYTDLATI